MRNREGNKFLKSQGKENVYLKQLLLMDLERMKSQSGGISIYKLQQASKFTIT